MAKRILEVKDLRTYFFTRHGLVKAVDGVSFCVDEGETLGIVGESGCGKSITCLSILRLVPGPAGRIVNGQILMNGDDLLLKSKEEMRQIRGKRISMILQDPMTSLNPVFTIGYQVGLPIALHQRLDKKSALEKVKEMLYSVRIPSPEVRVGEYPHHMSGGMRQRAVSGIALSCEPRLLIADEPTTSLDATIQIQFLRLLRQLQQETGLSLIFITHDFGIVAQICDRVAVMYAGKIVETADVRDLFNHPAHPYTRALLSAVPVPDPDKEKSRKRVMLEGEPPSPINPPSGCPFHPRCPIGEDRCYIEGITFIEASEGHLVRCWKAVGS